MPQKGNMDVKKRDHWSFAAGLLAVALSMVPLIMTGKNGFVITHDQLDGEVTTYMLLARHLKDRYIPEFMGGVYKTSLIPASYGTLLFYILLPDPFTAFLGNHLLIQCISYIGMYLLLKEAEIKTPVCVLSAVLFCLLPFYSVFGLSVMGQPLFFYTCFRLWKRNSREAYLLCCLFALFSSPILAGYVNCAFLGAAIVVNVLRDRQRSIRFLIQAGILAGCYLLLYHDLILNVVTGGDFVSHRSENVQLSYPWGDLFRNLFLNGQYHAASLHKPMIPWVIGTATVSVLVLLLKKNRNIVKAYLLLVTIALIILFTAFYAAWHCETGCAFRQKAGGMLVLFQADRFYWLYPCLWFLAFALAMDMIMSFPGILESLMPEAVLLLKKRLLYRILNGVAVLLCAFAVGSVGIYVFNSSIAKKDLDILSGTVSSKQTYDKFYSPGLFSEIACCIGRPQNEYRVGSINLHPSISLYNGFFSIDGYCLNYDVEHKHRFRKAMEQELDKDQEIRDYFDGWGNRCYLFSAELGISVLLPGRQAIVIEDLRLNHDALEDLGCDYIISEAEIKNPSDSGLTLMSSFEDVSSPYRIWLYKV